RRHRCDPPAESRPGACAVRVVSGKPRMSQDSLTTDECIFCEIIAGRAQASVVYEDALTVAFMDTPHFARWHVVVVPNAHLAGVRELDDRTGAALMSALANVPRAVSSARSRDDLSAWHSIGEAGGHEVPHLHFHVHPRRATDG